MAPTTNIPIISVDTGNRLMKTQHFTFSAGLKDHGEREPASLESTEILRRDKKYYTVSDQHLSNVPDKSTDERYINLCLISIAKELLMAQTPAASDGVIRTPIVLCLGLPIAHYEQFRRNYVRCYKGKTFTYSYRPQGGSRLVKFEVTVERVYVFPQGFAATQSSKEILRMTRDGICNIVDIGGYTTDIVQLVDGAPNLSGVNVATMNHLGFNDLAARINAAVEALTQERLMDSQIDNIIRNGGANSRVPKAMVNLALNTARDYAKELVNRLAEEANLSFVLQSNVFVGGGALCLRPYIEEAIRARYGSAASVKFIGELRANAIGYYVLASALERQR